MTSPPDKTREAAPGQLWELPLAGAGLLGWIVVRRHPEDPELVFLVPADHEQGLAEGDLAVPLIWKGQELTERCVLRAAFGGWLRETDLWHQVPDARVTEAWLAEVAQVDGLPSGDLPGELADWLRDELTPARAALEAWGDRLQARPELYPVPDREAGGADLVAEAALPFEPVPLAAAGSDALDQVLAEHAGHGDDSPGSEQERQLAGGLEGRATVLRLTASEVQLEVDGTAEPPRCLFLGPNGRRSFLRWTRHLHGGWRSQPVDLAELEAPPLRLVVEGERVHDLELDPGP